MEGRITVFVLLILESNIYIKDERSGAIKEQESTDNSTKADTK